jgi:hypothetical protein
VLLLLPLFLLLRRPECAADPEPNAAQAVLDREGDHHYEARPGLYLLFGSRGIAPLAIAESSEGFMMDRGQDATSTNRGAMQLAPRLPPPTQCRRGSGS